MRRQSGLSLLTQEILRQFTQEMLQEERRGGSHVHEDVMREVPKVKGEKSATARTADQG